MQGLIQIAIVVFVVIFIANKLQEPLFAMIAAYRKKKKEWDQNDRKLQNDG